MYTLELNKFDTLMVYESEDIIDDLLDNTGLYVPPYDLDDSYYTTKVLNNVAQRKSTLGVVVPALAFRLKNEGKDLLTHYKEMGYVHLFVPAYVTIQQFERIRGWYWQGLLDGLTLFFECDATTQKGIPWERYPDWHPVTRVTS